jgi:hypothetical protein
MNQSQLLEFAILLKHCQVVLVDSGGELAKVFCGIDLGHFVRWRLRIPFVPLLGSLVPKANQGIVLCIDNKGLVFAGNNNDYLKNVANIYWLGLVLE